MGAKVKDWHLSELILPSYILLLTSPSSHDNASGEADGHQQQDAEDDVLNAPLCCLQLWGNLM